MPAQRKQSQGKFEVMVGTAKEACFSTEDRSGRKANKSCCLVCKTHHFAEFLIPTSFWENPSWTYSGLPSIIMGVEEGLIHIRGIKSDIYI